MRSSITAAFRNIRYCPGLFCLMIFCWASPVSAQTMPKDFTLLSDVIPDIIQEIRYYSTYNFVGARIDGYEAPVAIMTTKAAQALKAVSDDVISQGYCLKVFDAYRPQRAVSHFVRWAADKDDVKMKPSFYPDIDKARVFELGFVARRSAHSRGSTVDLTLVNIATGKELDMGGPFDWFGELSHPAYPNLTPEQKANRLILREAMLRHGFRAITTEWWHYVLVDEPYPDTYFDFPVRMY